VDFSDNSSLWFSLKKFNKKIVEVDHGGETGKSPFFCWNRHQMINDWTQRFIADVENLAEPILRFEGMRLIDVEYRREPTGRVLRVFVDKQEGVTLDDCAMISNQLGDILDAKIDHDEPYHLEVSSPGLDRPLTKPKHFVYFEGRPAVIKTNRLVGGKRHFKGVLAGFSEGVVKLLVDEQAVSIPYEAIVKAHLSIEY
jgi:ribosome maturation factor RimP